VVGRGRRPFSVAVHANASEAVLEPQSGPDPREVRFADRRDAGRRLAALLANARYENPIVVGIAPDGVPVAAEVARALESPLDLLVVQKVGAPENPEHGIGALAEDESCVIDEEAVERLALGAAGVQDAIARARRRFDERLAHDRASGSRLSVAGRSVLLVDDGLVSPHSAQAAARSLRSRGAARVLLAVPVAARESVQLLRAWVDDVVCAETPEEVLATSLWYRDFSPTSDEEVRALLGAHTGAAAREVAIEVSPGVVLHGDLTVPWGAYARGVVVFAIGSGRSRLDPRNRRLARDLNETAIATLRLDLLTPREAIRRTGASDVELLALRLVASTRWLRRQPETAGIALGYFGEGTGSAAALLAAAEMGAGVCAIVSSGGRPDLIEGRLGEVVAPVLLIVGGADTKVLGLNRVALGRLRCASELAVIPGASRTFEQTDALDEVARLTADWFTRHLGEGALEIEAGSAVRDVR
jgi:putative phosphoribosyl transferase